MNQPNQRTEFEFYGRVMEAAFRHTNEMPHSLGPMSDFIAGAVFMAELYAEGSVSLRQTLEALREDIKKTLEKSVFEKMFGNHV